MSMHTTGIRFEYRPETEPALGLGTATPRLTWRTEQAPPGFAQTATEIEITRTLWGGEPRTETVTVDGPDQVLVDWPVAPLASRERAEVRIRTIGADGAAAWSEPAVVEAGLLEVAEWGEARFISPVGIGGTEDPAPVLVNELTLPADAVSARLHVTAHGWYEVRIGGKRVGADWFGPGWTAYEKRLKYYSYDVTELLQAGQNRVEVLLGNGWYRGELTWLMKRFYGERLSALLRLEVVTADGATLELVSDGTWRAAQTNIVYNEIYGGEEQDLRLPFIGEATASVEPVEESLERLVAAEGPPVRVTDVLPATQVWRSPSGKLLVDFGQNIVGVVRLKVRGLAAGTKVTLRHAEVLENDELGVRPLRKARAISSYTVAGGEETTLQPHFTFHGFRYAEVTGIDELDPADIEAVVLSSDMPRTGWFESSDPLLNQLHSNVVWGMKGNFLDVPTDCPQRDERLGWTGDIQVFSPSALFLQDSAGFLINWSADLAAEQAPSGSVPIVVPNVLREGMGALPAAAWGDAATFVPWNIYRATGDVEVLRRQVASMKAWVDCVAEVAGEDRLWTGQFQFGDWLDPDAPPEMAAAAKAHPDVVATAYFFRSAQILADTYEILDDSGASANYRQLAAEVREAFRNRFITPDGIVHSDCTTVYSQAILWGLLDEDQLAFAGARLADLARTAGFTISTGFVGTPLICDALTVTGHADIAHLLLTERACPSWLYPVTMGATTIWERWDSMLPDGSINPGEMTSFNHYALGAVADWMHRVVAGLSYDPLQRRIEVAPIPGAQLEHARARLLTPYGEAGAGWRREGDKIVVEATVPAGLTGLVRLPDGSTHEVGAGEHSFELAIQVEQAPTTVRELISSAQWPAVSQGLVELLSLSSAKELAQSLERSFDAPVSAVGGAATMGGMRGSVEQAQAIVDAVLAD